MLTFAVTVKGLDRADAKGEMSARWVLAVDPVGSRILVAHPDKSLHWYPLEDCKLGLMVDPAKPQPVTVVHPKSQKGPQILLPGGDGPLAL
jgi:hypothetical protein